MTFSGILKNLIEQTRMDILGTDFTLESYTSESPWLIMNTKPFFAQKIAGPVTAVLHIDKELLSIPMIAMDAISIGVI